MGLDKWAHTRPPRGGRRRLEESSLEAPLSISLAALVGLGGGETHDAIDGRRLKYWAFLRGWTEAVALVAD